jgi:hypothetical protein
MIVACLALALSLGGTAYAVSRRPVKYYVVCVNTL